MQRVFASGAAVVVLAAFTAGAHAANARAGTSATTPQAVVQTRPLKAGHPRGEVPKIHPGAKPPSRAIAAGTNPECTQCRPPLQFSAGVSVMGSSIGQPGHVVITPFYWAPSGYTFNATYKSIIAGYLQNVALDSQKPTNVFSVSTQYYQQDTAPGSPREHIDYVVAAGSEVDDTAAYPSGGCTPAAGYTACVDDTALQTEMSARLRAAGLQIDDARLYVALFPTGVETCEPPGTNNTVKCSANDYCAYHSSTASAPFLVYANEPMPTLPACADPYNGPQAPNGDPAADAQVSLISHEANESITDWAGAWMDSAQYEDGDQCNFVYGTPQGSPGAYYNQIVGSGKYYTQEEFSNEDYALGNGDLTTTGGTQVTGCIRQEELPTPSFAVGSVKSDVSARFDGTPSTDPDSAAPLSFTWTFGDGISLSGDAAPVHTYCSPGDDPVSLSVTDGDGWRASVMRTVTVGEGPPSINVLQPGWGPSAGGTAVTIMGCSFTGVTAVKFGSTNAASYTVASDRQINVITAAAPSGTVDVSVTTPAGTSPTAPAVTFNYVFRVAGGGGLASGPESAATGAVYDYAFAEGMDGQLWQNLFNGQAFGGWIPLGGVITGDPGAVPRASGIDVFVRGQDGALYHRRWDGTQWLNWDGLGGGMQYGPTVASWGDPRMDVFITGLDGQLWHRYWAGGSWSGWEPLGGVLTAAPAAVSWGDDRIDIFARGQDDQMWHMAWTATGWTGWQPMGGLFTTGAGVTSCASGHLDVFGIGMDGQLWRLGFNGTSWGSWQPLGGQWTSDPGASCLPGGNTVNVFVRGTDNGIWDQTVSGS